MPPSVGRANLRHLTEPFMGLQLSPEPFLHGMFGLIRLFRQNSRHLAKTHHEKSAGTIALGARNCAKANDSESVLRVERSCHKQAGSCWGRPNRLLTRFRAV